MNLSKKILGSALLVSALGLMSCGSASNNQGTSFTLVGFTTYSVDAGTNAPLCQIEKYDNTVTIPLGDSLESPVGEIATKRCLALLNNMTNVAVRTERVSLSYYIPGAEQQPPSTTAPVTVTLGAVSGSDAPIAGGGTDSGSTTDGATTAPTGINSIGNRAFAPINMVPAEVRSWINLNRSYLPEAPFSMDITVSVSAITSAGDRLESNQAYYQAQVTNDFVINPDDGTTGEATPTPTAE